MIHTKYQQTRGSIVCVCVCVGGGGYNSGVCMRGWGTTVECVCVGGWGTTVECV